MNVFSSTKCNKKMIEFLFLFIGFFSNNVYLNSKYFFYLALNMYDFSICSGNSFVVFARKKKTQKCKMEKRNEMKRNIICFFFWDPLTPDKQTSPGNCMTNADTLI